MITFFWFILFAGIPFPFIFWAVWGFPHIDLFWGSRLEVVSCMEKDTNRGRESWVYYQFEQKNGWFGKTTSPMAFARWWKAGCKPDRDSYHWLDTGTKLTRKEYAKIAGWDRNKKTLQFAETALDFLLKEEEEEEKPPSPRIYTAPADPKARREHDALFGEGSYERDRKFNEAASLKIRRQLTKGS